MSRSGVCDRKWQLRANEHTVVVQDSGAYKYGHGRWGNTDRLTRGLGSARLDGVLCLGGGMRANGDVLLINVLSFGFVCSACESLLRDFLLLHRGQDERTAADERAWPG